MLIAFAELDRDGLLSERKGFWLEAFPRLWRNPPAPLALCKGESTVDLRGPLGPGAFTSSEAQHQERRPLRACYLPLPLQAAAPYRWHLTASHRSVVDARAELGISPTFHHAGTVATILATTGCSSPGSSSSAVAPVEYWSPSSTRLV